MDKKSFGFTLVNLSWNSTFRVFEVSYFDAMTKNRIASLPTHLLNTSSTSAACSGLWFW